MKKPLSIERKRAKMGYVFLSPLIFGVVFLFLPVIIKTIVFSFNNTVIENGRYYLEWVGFAYYKKLFLENPKFLRMTADSVWQMIVKVPTIVIFSLFIASVLNQKFRGRVFARAVFFLPVVLATGIVTKVANNFDVSSVLSSRSVLDSTNGSTFFDVSAFLISLNFSNKITSFVISAANGIYDIVNASGMQIFIFLACFQEIPESLYEAASVDGCSKWEAFWKITIPSVIRQIIVTAVYTIIDIFTQPGSVLFTYIHNVAFSQNQYSYATCMYLVYLLWLGIVLAAAFLILKKTAMNKGRSAG